MINWNKPIYLRVMVLMILKLQQQTTNAVGNAEGLLQRDEINPMKFTPVKIQTPTFQFVDKSAEHFVQMANVSVAKLCGQ